MQGEVEYYGIGVEEMGPTSLHMLDDDPAGAHRNWGSFERLATGRPGAACDICGFGAECRAIDITRGDLP